jgi:hypothetical protein
VAVVHHSHAKNGTISRSCRQGEGKMAAELTNGRLFRWLSAEMFVGGVIGVFVAGMLWMGVQSSVAMAQTTADAAMVVAQAAERHSQERAASDAKEMEIIKGELSDIKSSQQGFATAIQHMLKQQERILNNQDKHQDRHNGDR